MAAAAARGLGSLVQQPSGLSSLRVVARRLMSSTPGVSQLHPPHMLTTHSWLYQLDLLPDFSASTVFLLLNFSAPMAN